MIEVNAYKYLSTALQAESIPVYMMAPENKPARYVLMEKTASTCVDHIETATIAIQSYGPTLLDAMNVNEAVKAAMLDITRENDFSKVVLNSDYNFTDTSTRQPRMQAVFVLTGANI